MASMGPSMHPTLGALEKNSLCFLPNDEKLKVAGVLGASMGFWLLHRLVMNSNGLLT